MLDRPPSKPPGGAAFEPIAAWIKAFVAKHGYLPSETEIWRGTAASRSTVHAVSVVFRTLHEHPHITAPVKFNKAQEHDIEAQIKARLRDFEKRVTEETKKRIDQLFPDLEQIRAEAALNERYYREMMEKGAVFTEAEFGNIRNCLHPDNSASADKRQLAFTTFNIKKLQLTGKK